MTEYLRAANIKPSPRIATALFHAIKTDTDNFIRTTVDRDIIAFRYLYGYANLNIVKNIGSSEMTRKMLAGFQKAIRRLQFINNISVERVEKAYVYIGAAVCDDNISINSEFAYQPPAKKTTMKTQPSSVVIVTTEARRAAIDDVTDTLDDVVMITEPADANAVVKQVRTAAARVVVLDSGIDGLEWPTAVHEITHLDNPPRVIVLGQPDKASLLATFREGADAYLNHGSLADELIPVLNAVENGRVAFDRNDADTIRNHMRYLELGSARNVAHIQNGISKLTVREKEVFPLLADGNSIKITARTLGISPKTVETHKYHIMKKLNLDSMADFTKLAMIKDLIPI